MPAPCSLCERSNDPEGSLVILRTRWAVLSHMAGIDLPGHLLLAPERHVEDAGSLTGEEEREMAHLTSRAVQASLSRPGVRKVYLLSFGEGVPHLYLHLFPRTEAILQDPASLTEGFPNGSAIIERRRQRLALSVRPPEMVAAILRFREILRR